MGPAAFSSSLGRAPGRAGPPRHTASSTTGCRVLFQAEDGIRDLTVTGVQTCALPIWPSFQRLQNRARIGRAPDIRLASVETPGTLYLFDLMAVEGFDLRSLPLVKRKALLRKVVPEAGPLRYSEHFEKDGEALYDRAVGMGLEGIVAKKADAPYKSGRSDLWQKIRADKTGDFVVVGYTAPKGSRGGFGALHLGGYADGKLVYAGRAGSRFSGQMLKDLGDQLLALEIPPPT